MASRTQSRNGGALLKSISDEFEACLQWGGTPVAVCHCGRTNYAASGENMEDDGELERLEARTAENADKCVPHQNADSVGVTTVHGRTYVFDCPCGSLEGMEAFLWENREMIGAYLKKRAAAEIARNQDVIAKLSAL